LLLSSLFPKDYLAIRRSNRMDEFQLLQITYSMSAVRAATMDLQQPANVPISWHNYKEFLWRALPRHQFWNRPHCPLPRTSFGRRRTGFTKDQTRRDKASHLIRAILQPFFVKGRRQHEKEFQGEKQTDYQIVFRHGTHSLHRRSRRFWHDLP